MPACYFSSVFPCKISHRYWVQSPSPFKSIYLYTSKSFSMFIAEQVVICTAFNSYFINSVEALIRSSSIGELDPVPINEDQPCFSIQDVSESTVTRVLGSFKNSRAKDVYGIDYLSKVTQRHTLSPNHKHCE